MSNSSATALLGAAEEAAMSSSAGQLTPVTAADPPSTSGLSDVPLSDEIHVVTMTEKGSEGDGTEGASLRDARSESVGAVDSTSNANPHAPGAAVDEQKKAKSRQVNEPDSPNPGAGGENVATVAHSAVSDFGAGRAASTPDAAAAAAAAAAPTSGGNLPPASQLNNTAAVATPPRGGRGGRYGPSVSGGRATSASHPGASVTPVPIAGLRGRGRGVGRPRGRGKARGTGRKRHRSSAGAAKAGSDENGSGDSESSEEFVAPATTTKSGRSVQKPTSFVPPPAPSPSTKMSSGPMGAAPASSSLKRKRPYRRNPESAVCKVCLRGTSPTTNMIVFCDGCNSPYHRYCHRPTIGQDVVDEVDMDWFCRLCEARRAVPVPEAEVSDWVSAGAASVEQKQHYFASLPPGLLVTLLVKATSLQPDLPIFGPDFRARTAASQPQHDIKVETQSSSNVNDDTRMADAVAGGETSMSQTTTSMPAARTNDAGPGAAARRASGDDEDAVPEDHPVNYPLPGHGLMKSRPSQQEDSQWLVEEDRFGVFTHLYQVDQTAANVGLNGAAVR